jgi:hypothetical protein
MITISVPVAMPAIEKVLVILMVRSPMPAVMPAASGTRLTGSAKLTRLSIQILAPSSPIIPYNTKVMPPRTPPGVAAITAPNFGQNPNKMATPAAM